MFIHLGAAWLALATLHVSDPVDGIGPPNPAARATAGEARPDAAAELKAILDEHVEWIKREDPVTASGRGDERFGQMLSDESPEAYARRRAEMVDRLARLRMIDTSALSEDDRINADVLRYMLETDIAGAKYFPEQTPLDSRSGPQTWLPQMGDRLPMRTAQQRLDYVVRLEKLPRLIDQFTDQMRAGLAARRVPPRVSVEGADQQCLALGSEAVRSNPGSSPFFKPLVGLPAEDELGARAKTAIAGKAPGEGIAGAYRRMGEFLRDEYIPQCRESVAIADGVDGPGLYDYLLRSHTTTEMTAEEIHQVGLGEVARIRAEMFRVIARTDWPQKASFKAGSDEQFDAFVKYLRTDPRFYYTDPAALLEGYRDICKRIDAELPRLFSKLPRNTYGVREIPALSAPHSPMGYYYGGSLKSGVPAYFVVNTYRLDQRPKYEMIALTLHEAVPGHHLQIALAQELGGEEGTGGAKIHEFRSWTGFNAFAEGWALYAERLGMEMTGGEAGPGAPVDEGTAVESPAGERGRGMFTDPYDDFGRLSYEMWRACRLVVDTGMHAQGWSRQRAIDFMLANTALSPLNIEREVDRYIGWPGQACAYKIGELKIRKLRERAEGALGKRFDLRAFHACILGAGQLPLPVLEARVERWMESMRRLE